MWFATAPAGVRGEEHTLCIYAQQTSHRPACMHQQALIPWCFTVLRLWMAVRRLRRAGACGDPQLADCHNVVTWPGQLLPLLACHKVREARLPAGVMRAGTRNGEPQGRTLRQQLRRHH